MKKTITLLFVIIMTLCCVQAQPEHYVINHYSIEDGLSQNTVMAIMQDKQGYMWFGTWDGLNRFDGYEFTVYKGVSNGEQAKVNNRVDFIFEDEKEQLWWMTYDSHYYMLDKERKNVTEKTHEELPHEMLEQMVELEKNLRVDKAGTIWQVDDEEGILRYRFGQWKRLKPELDSRFAGQLREHLIVLEDRLGRTWVNPTGGGWSYYDAEKDELVNPFATLTNMIHTAYVDRNGLMWVSTYDNGVNCINMEPQPYMLHDMRKSGNELGEVRAFAQLSNGDVETIVKDKRRIYCIAETSHGLLYGTKGHGLMDAKTGKVIPTSSKDIYDIAEGSDGTLYVATYGDGISVVKFDNNGNPMTPIVIGNGMKVRCATIVDNILWCGTTTGILRIDLTDLSSQVIPSYDIRAIYYSQDKLWIGTFGGGLNVLDPKQKEPTITQVQTGQDIVMSIVGDGKNLWYSSESTITQMNIESGECNYFDALDGQPNTTFTEAKALRTKTGNILFGYSNGYCEFDPSRVYHSAIVSPIKITHCSSNGEVSDATNDTIYISNKSNLSITYAALSYVNSHQITYAYKLDGVDKDWIEAFHQRNVTYSNLRHGKYTFHVFSTDHQGTPMENEILLTVIVKKPLWMSWWAIMLYILFALVLLIMGGYAFWTYNNLRQRVMVEQQVTDIKLRFFTNISHELRTPLTLIIGPIENILNTEHINSNVRNQLEIVQNNSRRMLRIVNQLLDFRKIQNNKMRLKVQKSLMSSLAEETCANFKKEAYDKHINFNLRNNAADSTVWVDRHAFDTILFNLLSNAFKFTPAGKNIDVIVEEKPGFAILKVKDQGIGIPMEKRNILFERFSSNNELSGPKDPTGTGIGMNLVKELVDLHHGFIEVESELGKGTTFTILFRKGKEHFGNEVEIVVDDSTSQEAEAQPQDSMEARLASLEMKSNKRKLLIVDDNEDMRAFMIEVLNKDYEIRTAGDGVEALKSIENEMPDMIITDLMMPNMDGLELTSHIKHSSDLNHIPVILLTAKSAIESRLEAMNIGADDYVTKPFEPEYLQARIRNILSQREQLETSYRKRLMNLEPEKNDESAPADAFLAKLLDLMNKQMDNNTLTVDELVEDMGMGRTVFFNKLKSLTGLSPVEFIREMRIKRAAQLLEQKNYNITEVTYMVGMNDSRYFAKCFKQTYGMTPSEYRKAHKVDDEPTKK